jgi:p-hydroxybenzoate 3-monooxygenase
VLTAGHQHDPGFGGESRRVDFTDLVGEAVWLCRQNEVFTDLAEARERDVVDVRFGIPDTAVSDLTGPPCISLTGADGAPKEVRAEILVGADGSQSLTRRAMPPEHRTDHLTEYPFAWFRILCEAPPSAEELIYAHSEHGFDLISQRSDTVQRMYLQCCPDEDASARSEDRIGADLQKRVDGPTGSAAPGADHRQDRLELRSYPCEPLRYRNLFLAGDAGHTVPQTSAKGLNLAFADVQVLFEGIGVLDAALVMATLDSAGLASTGSRELLDRYSERALDRVWRAQHFSDWVTSSGKPGPTRIPATTSAT